jgi:uncharacterized membrane protein YeaQ/YmgE (transglycosylase-associated protein family)
MVELQESLQAFAQQVLIWIGFGTLVGLFAKALMPGRDPGGAIGTVLMGIVGSVVGCSAVSYFWRSVHLTPISPLGFVAGTAGAFVILLFYRILGGYYFQEAVDGDRFVARRRYVRPRRRVTVLSDDRPTL